MPDGVMQPDKPAREGPSATAGPRFWFLWFVALAGAVCIHLWTAPFSPPVGQDESQIVEYGRALLQPCSDWSMNLVSAGHPLVPVNYIGFLLQELAYRLTASHTGPRVSALLGAALAATMLVGWLVARGTEGRFAWLLGAAFFLDPILTSSFRSGRIDALAMAPCIGAAWLLRSRLAGKRPLRCCCAAGGLAAVGFLLWPSTALTFPLLLSELVAVPLGERASAKSAVQLTLRLAMLLVGGIMVSAVLTVPLIGQLRAVIQGRRDYLAIYGSNSLVSNTLAFAKVAARTPILALLALLGTLRRTSRGLVLTALAAVAWTLTMHVYTYRLVYLLPFAIGLASSGFNAAGDARPVLGVRRLSRVLVYVCLAWAVGLSLGARTYVGLRGASKRDPLMLTQEARRSIGSGPHKVYVGPYELYYSGRALGWKMFRSQSRGSDLKRPLVESLLRNVDYAILPAGGSVETEGDYLAQMGLRRADSLFQNNVAGARSVLGFDVGFAGYGPYIVYRRFIGTDYGTGAAERGPVAK